jgi:hypothetical protein
MKLAERKGIAQSYDLVRVDSFWELRDGQWILVFGSGLEVVLFLKKERRDGVLIQMWDEAPVTIYQAIQRINYADWKDAS